MTDTAILAAARAYFAAWTSTPPGVQSGPSELGRTWDALMEALRRDAARGELPPLTFDADDPIAPAFVGSGPLCRSCQRAHTAGGFICDRCREKADEARRDVLDPYLRAKGRI